MRDEADAPEGNYALLREGGFRCGTGLGVHEMHPAASLTPIG